MVLPRVYTKVVKKGVVVGVLVVVFVVTMLTNYVPLTDVPNHLSPLPTLANQLSPLHVPPNHQLFSITASSNHLPLFVPPNQLARFPSSPNQLPPIPASSNQPPPIHASPNQPPPIPVSPNQPTPIPVSPNQPPPIPVSPNQPPPIPVSPNQPPPIPVSPNQPPPIPVSPNQPPPIPASAIQPPPFPGLANQIPLSAPPNGKTTGIPVLPNYHGSDALINTNSKNNNTNNNSTNNNNNNLKSVLEILKGAAIALENTTQARYHTDVKTNQEVNNNNNNRSNIIIINNNSNNNNNTALHTSPVNHNVFQPKTSQGIELDPNRREVTPWSHDPSCGHYKIGLAPLGTLMPCALASYPGSGNTWLRSLLQAAGGIFTGSIYRDQQLYMSGYLGELDPWDSGTTLTQKTHNSGVAHIRSFNGTVVLLLRNPYRAILAYHNYLFGGHTGFASVSNYRRKDWGAFVHLQARSWLDVAVNWTRLGQAVKVVHYEGLLENPAPILAQALQFVGIPPNQHRLECLMKHQTPGFRRRAEFIPEGLKVFSDVERDKLDRAIRYVDHLLREGNHEPLPLHLYHFYNNTPSQMLEVKCLAGESAMQCDYRVDTLNHIRTRVPGSQTVNTDREGEVEGRSSTTTSTTTTTARGGSEKQDPLRRFVDTKLGYLMTHTFNTIMKATQRDPITQALNAPERYLDDVYRVTD